MNTKMSRNSQSKLPQTPFIYQIQQRQHKIFILSQKKNEIAREGPLYLIIVIIIISIHNGLRDRRSRPRHRRRPRRNNPQIARNRPEGAW